MTNLQNRSTQNGQAPAKNNTKHKNSSNTSNNNNLKNAAKKATFFGDNSKYNNRKATGNASVYFANNNNNNNNNSTSQSKENGVNIKQSNFTSKDSNPHRRNFNHHHLMKSYQHSTGRISPRSPISFASPAGVCISPPNMHFASSKYLDAPSPTTLPAPPTRWITDDSSKRRLFQQNTKERMPAATSCSLASAAEVAGRSLCTDIFSQNLKLILNVQS